ncbi:MAG: small multi-drug export protein [bacterium]|nr:small multi-drug export protein [bacterium]
MDVILIELSKVASMFGLAMVSFWAAIPFGLALGLSPFIVIAIATVSYSTGVVVIVFFGDRIRTWITKWRKKTADEEMPNAPDMPNERIRKIWEQYGVWGLGIIAPVTLGSLVITALGVMLNAHPYRLILAMTVGALIWSIGLTLAVMVGVVSLQAATL